MICKECYGRQGGSIEEGGHYTYVELCPRHALVDRLAEALRHVYRQNGFSLTDMWLMGVRELLKEYDSTSTANPKERV